MKKILSVLITLIVIVAIGLLLPYFMGVLAQKKCQELAGTFANLARVEITVTDYKRHWFDSNATFMLKLRQPLVLNGMGLDKANSELQQLTVNAHILHGPVVISPRSIKLAQAVVEAEVVLTREQNALLQRENDALPLANISLGINLDGSSSLRIKGAPLTFKVEKVGLNLQGLNIQVAFSAFLNKIKSTIDLPSFDFSHEDSLLHVEGLTVNYVGAKNNLDLWVGQRQVALKSLSVKSGSNDNLALAGFMLTTNVTEEQRLVTAQTTISLDSLNFNNMSYTQNTIDWEANNLDVAMLAKLQHEIRKLSDMSDPSLQQGMSIVKYLGLLLSKGVTLNIKQVASHTPWGEFMAAGQIDAAKNNDEDFLAVLTNLRGEFNLQVEQALAQYLLAKYYESDVKDVPVSPEEQAKNTLNEWLKSGTILLEGTAYKTKVKYDKRLLINDKPISFGNIQQHLPANPITTVVK